MRMSQIAAIDHYNPAPTDPERWTNIPLLVKIFKLIINELSTVMEANASRANAADWSQGESA